MWNINLADLPQPHRIFPKPCRRAAANTPRGNGIRPQSTFGGGFRTRGFTSGTDATGATSPGNNGRNNAGSIASARQTGRKTPAAQLLAQSKDHDRQIRKRGRGRG